MTILRSTLRIMVPALAGILILTGPRPTSAASIQLITNGDFEALGGSLTGWSAFNQPGGDGTFTLQSGTSSPLSQQGVPAPPGLTHAAMSDGGAPGSHVLLQDFTVPTGIASATLSFSRFVQNGATAFFSPSTLDFSNVNNQQARVDIIGGSANPFSVAASDVLLNVFHTSPGDPLVSGYTTQTVDVTSLLQSLPGQTLGLRFAEADNQFLFQFGVDQVSLTINTVPEPASLVMAGTSLVAGLGCWLRRRRRGAA
jgi:PEP-CTERM motif